MVLDRHSAIFFCGYAFTKRAKFTVMKRFLIISFVALLMGACEPTPDEQQLFDQYVVSTSYDDEADFSSYLTYTIPTDTIGLISNIASDDTIIIVRSGQTYPRDVINAVQQNMNARGFQKVERTEDPDVALNIFVVKNLNIFQQVNYYPGYYGYPGYYYPSYYGYNYYYGYPAVSTYVQNTGVLVVEIVDLKNVNAQNQVKVIWNAYMGDVFSSIDLRGQSEEAIDQAFDQSPYITTN